MTGSPFELLGVAPDAGEREIKQAYARLLKRHRPDEDPDGFQRANEAYQVALALRMTEVERHGSDTPPSAPRSTSPSSAPGNMVSAPEGVPRKPHPSSRAAVRAITDDGFDFADFFLRLQAYAKGRSPEAVERWLDAEDALLRIGRTDQVGDQLCAVFADGDPHGFGSEHINAIEEFFNIDTGLDLHPRVQALWAVQDGRTSSYGQTLSLPIEQLKRRFTLWQAVLVTCMPTMTWRIDTLGDDLVRDYGALPPGINPEQRAFFARQNDPGYLGPWRWLPVLFNGALPAVPLLVLAFLFGKPERALPIALWCAKVYIAAVTVYVLLGWVRARGRRRRARPE